MRTTIASSADPELIHPSEVPKLRDQIELTCKSCGRSGHYDVGAVLISPRYADTDGADLGSFLSFSHYFLCRRCNAGGPWAISARTQAALLLHFDWCAAADLPCGVMVGESTCVDGRQFRYPAQTAAYLQSLLEQNPTDAELWLRLGNVYHNGGRSDLAQQPLLRALELDPHNTRVHFVLARGCEATNRRDDALERWLRLLECAAADSASEPDAVRRGVSVALHALAKADRLGDAFEILKARGRASIETRAAGRPVVLEAVELDLSDADDWDRMCAMFLHRPRSLASRSPRCVAPAADAPQPLLSSTPLNARCPCGSGHKYKKCCGAPPGRRAGIEKRADAHV